MTLVLCVSAFLVCGLPASLAAEEGENGLVFDLEKEVRFFGRTYVNEGVHYFNWSASGFTFSFKGSGAVATIVSNAPGSKNNAYLKIIVDGEAQTDAYIDEKTQKVTLARALDPKKKHTVTVLKRTNARSSTAGVAEIRLTDGKKLAPEEKKDRLIEFVGDSFTVGYAAAENAAGEISWSTAAEDVTGTYAKLVADAFKSDYNVTAISGRGIVRNYEGGTSKRIPEIYSFVDQYNLPNVPYDFAEQPDVIVINLGDNDASGNNASLTGDEVTAGTVDFLKQVREKNPDAVIIWAFGLINTKFAPNIEAGVKEMNEAGDDKIYYLAFDGVDSSEIHLGHPLRSAYVKSADRLIDFISEVTGWKKPLKLKGCGSSGAGITVLLAGALGFCLTAKRKFKIFRF